MPTKTRRASTAHLENKTHQLLLTSYRRHLMAEGKAPATVDHYIGSATEYLEYAEQNGLPELATMRREHVEMWLEELRKAYSPHSVRNRFIGLRLFFKWLLEDGEVQKNPMERIKPPIIEESPKDVVSVEDMAKVLGLLERNRKWRDAALISLLYDTGMRASEVADCRTEHVNLETKSLLIPKTKANRIRVVSLSSRAVRSLDRYWRRPRKEEEWAFNGPRGKMTRSGVYSAVTRVFREAGIAGTIGAHDLRHTSASHVVGVMSESAMMTLYGWTDPAMARHYARQALVKNAFAEHAAASPLERLPR